MFAARKGFFSTSNGKRAGQHLVSKFHLLAARQPTVSAIVEFAEGFSWLDMSGHGVVTGFGRRHAVL